MKILKGFYDKIEKCENIKIDKMDIYVNVDKNKCNVMNADYLYKILVKTKKLYSFKPQGKTLHFNFHGAIFGDDAVVLYFELIFMDLIEFGYKKIYIKFQNLYKYAVTNELYNMSLLARSLKNGKLDCVLFSELYKKTYVESECSFKYNDVMISNNCIRMTIKNDKNNKSMVSTIGGYIFDYLENLHVFDAEYIESVLRVSMETIDNSLSHTDSDCYFSMKFCSSLINQEQEPKLMLSIVIMNTDEKLIYSDLKYNYYKKTLGSYSMDLMSSALQNHKKYFNELYDEDFFMMISAFQKGITTRKSSINSSGRGLTQIVKSIINKTEVDECYVYSGNRLLMLNDKYLNLDANGCVGFNDEKDYVKFPPNMNILRKFEYYNCGTLYNLFLIYDRGEINE